MALVLNNRVRETTSTTGTGAVTFAGAVDGFQTFAAGIGNDNTTYYAISLNSEDEWEVGLGTLSADSSTLARTNPPLESSNGDALVNFSAGAKEIFCTLPAEKAMYLDASGAGVGGLAAVVDDTTPQLGGNLDVNGNAIVSASDGAIAINANGTGTVTMTTNSVTGDVIPGKREGTDFTDSLLVGHSTTGTLDAAARNTAVGIDAMQAITSADDSTCIGYQAGKVLTSGAGNTAVGSYAGLKNTDGAYNTFIGNSAGYNTAGGHRNTFLGTLSGNKTTTGDDNIAIGMYAGRYNATGDYNTVLGSNALTGVSTNNHSSNTAIGGQSLLAVTTGDANIALGRSAGDNITSGSGNVVIGKADVSSATGDDQLSISDGEDGAVVWMTGDSSGNVVFAGTATAAGSLLATQGDATALAVALG